LLKHGLIPEFVGRLPVLATLEDLDELALKRILREPKNALVKQYQRLFEMEGVDLTLAEEALGAIARKAIDRKMGARGLRAIMEGILLDTMFDLPSLEGVKEAHSSASQAAGRRKARKHPCHPPEPFAGKRVASSMWLVEYSWSVLVGGPHRDERFPDRGLEGEAASCRSPVSGVTIAPPMRTQVVCDLL